MKIFLLWSHFVREFYIEHRSANRQTKHVVILVYGHWKSGHTGMKMLGQKVVTLLSKYFNQSLFICI